MATGDNEGLQAEIGITVGKIARQLADVESRMTRTAKNIEKKFEQSNQRAAATFKKIDDASGRTSINIGKMGGALAAAFSLSELQRYADGWTSAGNKIAAAASSTGGAARSLSAINDIADDSRSSLSATADLYSKLLRSTAAFGASEEKVALATALVAKSFKAGGASAAEAEGAIVQLGQALGSGKLSGDELNSLLENAPVLAQALADAFGVTVGKLKELGKEGELTSAKVFDAILKGQPKIEAAFNATNATIADGFTRLNNALTEYIGAGDAALGVSDKLVAALGFLADNIDLVVAAGLILTGRFLGPMAAKFLVETAAQARIAAGAIGGIGGGATVAARGIGALKAVMGILGGPVGILITALTLLPMLVETTGEKIDAAKAAAENGETALAAYADASKRAADEQDRLAGKVTAATQQMVNQTRAGLQRALEEAIAARDELVDSLDDGTFLNGKLTILSQQMGGLGQTGYGNEFLAEMSKAFGDLASGARTDLDAVVERLQAVQGAGEELNAVADQFDMAKLDPINIDLGEASKKLVDLAKQVGLFGDELAAIDAARSPEQAAAAYEALEKKMREAAEAGGFLRSTVDPATDELLTTTVKAKDEVERLQGALVATGDELQALADGPKPFEGIADDAGAAADEIERLSSGYAEYARTRQQGAAMAGNDAMSAARAVIKDHEGFRNEPYYDVNAWRAGYGSDTGTRADGSTYSVQKGVSVSTADAERDLDRRINSYFGKIIQEIGQQRFDGLSPDQKATLASLIHNYGAGDFSQNGDLAGVVRGLLEGNSQATADAITALGSHNGGINAGRRAEEAQAFGGGSTMASESVREANELAAESARLTEERNAAALNLLSTQEAANAEALFELGLSAQLGAASEDITGQITRQRVETDLLNQAKAAGIDVDKQLTESGETYRASIERLAIAAGEAAQAEVDAASKRESAIERTQFLADTASQISQGLASAFVNSIRSAENFGDAVSRVFSDVLANIAEMIVQQTIYNAIAGAFGLKPQGGGILGALGLGIPGLAEGGFAGVGSKHDPAGIYHKGEYIVPADAVRQIGVPALEQLSATGDLSTIASPFKGGSAGSMLAAPGGSSAPNVNVAPAPVEIYPVLSDEALGKMVGRPGVQKVIIDLIQREGFQRG